MRQHLMLDKETLGNKANTAILSLGAVFFTKDGLQESIYLVPSLKEQIKKRSVDAGTLCWWIKQNQNAKSVFDFALESQMTIAGLASDFSCFIDKNCQDKRELFVWSNGAGFDVPIIEHLLESAGLSIPWQYWNIRCYRTLKYLFPELEKGQTISNKHHALDDAKFQASNVIRFLKNNPEFDR